MNLLNKTSILVIIQLQALCLVNSNNLVYKNYNYKIKRKNNGGEQVER